MTCFLVFLRSDGPAQLATGSALTCFWVSLWDILVASIFSESSIYLLGTMISLQFKCFEMYYGTDPRRGLSQAL
jgi:hypothetical protein